MGDADHARAVKRFPATRLHQLRRHRGKRAHVVSRSAPARSALVERDRSAGPERLPLRAIGQDEGLRAGDMHGGSCGGGAGVRRGFRWIRKAPPNPAIWARNALPNRFAVCRRAMASGPRRACERLATLMCWKKYRLGEDLRPLSATRAEIAPDDGSISIEKIDVELRPEEVVRRRTLDAPDVSGRALCRNHGGVRRTGTGPRSRRAASVPAAIWLSLQDPKCCFPRAPYVIDVLPRQAPWPAAAGSRSRIPRFSNVNPPG